MITKKNPEHQRGTRSIGTTHCRDIYVLTSQRPSHDASLRRPKYGMIEFDLISIFGADDVTKHWRKYTHLGPISHTSVFAWVLGFGGHYVLLTLVVNKYLQPR